jgi:hypothetical protein
MSWKMERTTIPREASKPSQAVEGKVEGNAQIERRLREKSNFP